MTLTLTHRFILYYYAFGDAFILNDLYWVQLQYRLYILPARAFVCVLADEPTHDF